MLLILLPAVHQGLFAQVKKGGLQGGMALKYIVKEPAVVTANTPVIILLHGVGSNEQDLFSLAGQLPPQAIVISARGPITLKENAFGWYHLKFATGAPDINPGEALQSRDLIVQFIGQIAKKYNTGVSHIYLMGFSQGAIMSYYVALTQPGKLKGIVALSGRLLDEVKPKTAAKDKLTSLSVFMAHGNNDKVLNVQYSRDADKYIKKEGINNAYNEYPMGHEISPAEIKDIQKWFANEFWGKK